MKSSEISGLEKYRGRNFCIGLITSLSFALGAINYTTYEVPFYEMDDGPEIEVETVEVIRTAREKKKVLPPPPKMDVIEKLDLKEEMEFIEEKPVELEKELLGGASCGRWGLFLCCSDMVFYLHNGHMVWSYLYGLINQNVNTF